MICTCIETGHMHKPYASGFLPGWSRKEYSFGRFIRYPPTVFELEGLRKIEVVRLAVLIQRVYRGWHQWRRVSREGGREGGR